MNYPPFDESGLSGAAVYLFKDAFGCDYIPIGYSEIFFETFFCVETRGFFKQYLFC